MENTVIAASPLDIPVMPVAWIKAESLDWLRGGPQTRRLDSTLRGRPEDGDVPIYSQAELDNARQAIYGAESAQLTAPLRAKIEALELAEEGAKDAFGHVVQQKRDLEAECKRLRGLLDAAHADIRRMAQGHNAEITGRASGPG